MRQSELPIRRRFAPLGHYWYLAPWLRRPLAAYWHLSIFHWLGICRCGCRLGILIFGTTGVSTTGNDDEVLETSDDVRHVNGFYPYCFSGTEIVAQHFPYRLASFLAIRDGCPTGDPVRVAGIDGFPVQSHIADSFTG